MKVSLPTVREMNELQRCKEFTQEGWDFPEGCTKKKLTIKSREGKENFEQKLCVISGSKTAEQFVIWLKTFTKELIVPERVRNHLGVLGTLRQS